MHTTTLERPTLRIRHMRHMVWGIEVYAIPASWEALIYHDTHGTRTIGKVERFWFTCSLVVHAGIGQLAVLGDLTFTASIDISDEHAKSL